MPQATNRQLVRDVNNTPVGQGTVYNAMLKISAATRERAKNVNEGEQLRLGKVTRVMERHRRVADNTQNRQLEKMQKQLKDLQAFQTVLRDKYSIDNFRTLKLPPQRMSDRRRKLETMFYSCGFSQKTMQPEIRRQLQRTDPARVQRKFKRHLLESCRQDVVRLVDRNSQLISDMAAISLNDVTGETDDIIEAVTDGNDVTEDTANKSNQKGNVEDETDEDKVLNEGKLAGGSCNERLT
ncbi:uncharacterized protein [Littorina saxatilis]|uniref:Uncharacterized protein n=1 Tax=Littorina saxatilis TaxID=31220 RepID=A0AAN9BTH7_9CAEN